MNMMQLDPNDSKWVYYKCTYQIQGIVLAIQIQGIVLAIQEGNFI
jgi:hypothetical protein